MKAMESRVAEIALMTSLGIEGNTTPTRDISEYEELVQKKKKEIEQLKSDMATIEKSNGELIIRKWQNQSSGRMKKEYGQRQKETSIKRCTKSCLTNWTCIKL